MSDKRLNENSVSKAKRQKGVKKNSAAAVKIDFIAAYFFIPRSIEETAKRLSAKSMLYFTDFICMVEECPV